MKKSILILFILAIAVLLAGCKSGKTENLSNSNNESKSSFSEDKKQIRRTGDVDLIVKDADKTRDKIYAICKKYKAKIMTDNIRTDTNMKRNGDFRIRVDKNEFFNAMDEIKKIGKIKNLRIYEEDESYNIEKLKEEIKSPKNSPNEKDNFKKRLEEVQNNVDYSIIYISYEERLSFFAAIGEGFSEGIGVVGPVFKVAVIMLFGIIPFVILIAFLLTFYSFIRWHWKLFLVKIENIIGKKARQKYLKERK